MKLYKKKCEGPIKTGIRQGIIGGIGLGTSYLFLYSVYASGFYAGAELVKDRKTSFSDVFRVSSSPKLVRSVRYFMMLQSIKMTESIDSS